jgi:hypothetical protein
MPAVTRSTITGWGLAASWSSITTPASKQCRSPVSATTLRMLPPFRWAISALRSALKPSHWSQLNRKRSK